MEEVMADVYPFDDGRSVVDEDTLSVTSIFPIGQDMVNLGYKMVSADIDEEGYFLTVQFTNIRINHARSFLTGVTLCEKDTDDFLILDTENLNRKCPKCYKMITQRHKKEGET